MNYTVREKEMNEKITTVNDTLNNEQNKFTVVIQIISQQNFSLVIMIEKLIGKSIPPVQNYIFLFCLIIDNGVVQRVSIKTMTPIFVLVDFELALDPQGRVSYLIIF